MNTALNKLHPETLEHAAQQLLKRNIAYNKIRGDRERMTTKIKVIRRIVRAHAKRIPAK